MSTLSRDYPSSRGTTSNRGKTQTPLVSRIFTSTRLQRRGLVDVKQITGFRTAFILVVLFGGIAGGITGCKTTAKTPPASTTGLPEAASGLDEIVADLRANDVAIGDIRAAATFTLESPEKMKSIQRFPSGSVRYRRPADLYVEGKNGLGATLFKLTSRGAEFVIEFPSVQDTDDRYFCSFEVDDIANVPFPVAPADIAREMFMPIDWSQTSVDAIKLRAYDMTTAQATLEIALQNDLVRHITVQGKPWVIVHNTLTHRDGMTLSDTAMSNYEDHAGIRFPANVEAWFPSETTRISFELRNVRINTGLPDSTFAFTWPAGQ